VHSAQQLAAGIIIIEAAWEEAVIEGHDMLSLEPDCDVGSYTAPCQTCRGWLSADIAYGLEPYGSVYLTRCPGPPPPEPAVRRSDFDREAASAHAGLERKAFSPTIDYRLNWDDPERNMTR
jgi:hypothetical protein